MRMYDIIMKKRNGEKLSREEIDFVIENYTKEVIPDYQMSAFLMAVYFKGMSSTETVDMTMAMAKSGDMLNLDKIEGIKADKHSTGGVGDKVSLILGPMVASLGVPVAKMSGRGLGHTGGTIDKLESFKGFCTAMSEEQFVENVNAIKIAITGQTGNLAPADKKIYALRDVTATVDSLPLIASSIMSKKIASGADAIVLDVKCGSGAFMKTTEDAKALAAMMVKIGNEVGRKTVAVISDMDEPLGYTVGNALEVKEAIDTLNGNGPEELLKLCVELGKYMLFLTGKTATLEEAERLLYRSIEEKTALHKLAEFVKAQGGDERAVYDMSLLPKASIMQEIKAPKSGYISHIRSDEVGMASLVLGGGREKKDSVIDLSVGIVLAKKMGDYVAEGDTIAVLHANDRKRLEEAKKRLEAAYEYSNVSVAKQPFIKGIVEYANGEPVVKMFC